MNNFDTWLQTEPDYSQFNNNDSDGDIGDVEACDEENGW